MRVIFFAISLLSSAVFAQGSSRDVLATCSDESEQIGTVTIYTKKADTFYLAEIEISDASGKVEAFNGGILTEKQVDLFKTTTEISLPLMGIPTTNVKLDQFGNIIGGFMIQLQRLYDDPAPYLSAYLAKDGKLIELYCE